MSEARALRHRQATFEGELDRLLAAAPGGSTSVLAQTTVVASYPTSAGVLYAMAPITIDGAETEGATPAYHADATRTFYAVNLGTQVPPRGTLIVCCAVGGRWVFRYDG